MTTGQSSQEHDAARAGGAITSVYPAPSAPHRDAIHVLWDALVDFPAAQCDAALVYLMRTLCDRLGAGNVVWVGGVRMARGDKAHSDPQHGWRGRAMRSLVSTPAIDEKFQRAMREQDADPAGTTRAITAEAGVFRVRRLRDGFLDFEAFRRTPHYRLIHQGLGITDRMWAAFPVNEDAESYFVFDHMRARRRFSQSDVALVAYALRGIKWFHRQAFLSYGLMLAQEPLSPAQRRVLFVLLTDRTEKQIAEQLRLTPGSTHQYAVELYRKLGVKGRAGLMALWLGR